MAKHSRPTFSGKVARWSSIPGFSARVASCTNTPGLDFQARLPAGQDFQTIIRKICLAGQRFMFEIEGKLFSCQRPFLEQSKKPVNFFVFIKCIKEKSSEFFLESTAL
jgi:hypothetical protein